MKTSIINQPITVTAVDFRRNMSVCPRRIEWAGKSYSFIDSGICAVVKRGEKIANIFTMSDGESIFHLRKDGAGWTLLSVGV